MSQIIQMDAKDQLAYRNLLLHYERAAKWNELVNLLERQLEDGSWVTGENVFYDHGRGIFLINELMDRVEYRNGGTEIWMRKK